MSTSYFDEFKKIMNYVCRFDGKVVAKLPFVPISFLQGISHRNLPGSDYTDCSFIFLYILCTMAIRQVSKLLTVVQSYCKRWVIRIAIFKCFRMCRNYSDLLHHGKKYASCVQNIVLSSECKWILVLICSIQCCQQAIRKYVWTSAYKVKRVAGLLQPYWPFRWATVSCRNPSHNYYCICH